MKKQNSISKSPDLAADDIPVYGSTPATISPGNPDIWSVALAAKWWLALGLGVGLMLGYLALLKLGPSYDATARILVTKKIPKQVKEDDREGTSLGDRAEHIHLILSPKVIGPAIEKHQLDQLKSLVGEDEAEREIIDALRVRRIGGQEKSTLNVFELTFGWGNQNDANKILSAVIDSYNDYLLTSRQKHGADSIESIRTAANALWTQVKSKEQEYSKFRQHAPLIWKTPAGGNGQPGDTTNVYQQRVLDYEAERRKNRAEITGVQSKISALNAAIQRGDSKENLEVLVRSLMQLQGGSLSPSLTNESGQVATLQTTLLPYLLEESKLQRAGFGPKYHALVTVRDNIRRVKDFYRRQGTVLPEEKLAQDPNGQPKIVPTTDVVAVYQLALRYSLESLNRREEELSKLFETADTEVKKFDHFLTQDKQFNDDILRLKTLHSDELTRLAKAELVKDDEGYSMEEIVPVHTEKSLKRPIQCLGMGGAMGIAMAFGLVYLRALADTRLKSAEELRNQFGLSILGRIPAFSASSLQAAARSRPTLEPSLFYLTRPGSIEAEAYRSVRTALFFRCQKAGHRVIQVTSPEAQDGKTTLAANLALAMAHSGKKVLLMDADMRCPKVQKIFRLQHQIGLSDVVLGEILFENAVQTTEIEGLSLLAAGLTPANPAELLGGQSFEKLMVQLRSEFDYIIVDTPPLMAVSDPCIVASLVDAMVLVVRVGKNRLQTIRNACELLTTLGIEVLGAVANNVTVSNQDGYGKAYGDSYFSHSTTSSERANVQVSPSVTLNPPKATITTAARP